MYAYTMPLRVMREDEEVKKNVVLQAGIQFFMIKSST